MHRTYTLELNGELAGHHVVMSAMTAREIIRTQRGELTESDVLEMVGARCIEHDFDTVDLLEQDYWIVGEILDAWGTAMQEGALPPQNGASSPAASVPAPSAPRRR